MLKSSGFEIDRSPEKFGKLLESSAYLEDAATLRARMAEHGYLFFRGLLDKAVLNRLREHIAEELERAGVLDSARRNASEHLPARRGVNLYTVMPWLDRATVHAVAQQQSLIDLFSNLFGERVRALDYSWPRAVGPGRSEATHADWVYMCRGTPRICSTWIPLMDVPLSKGPLMILEGSHFDNKHTRKYLALDADELGLLEGLRLKHGHFVRGGRYSWRPHCVRDDFGTRWLSEDFRLGDAVVFSTRTLHATLENQTDSFRVSIDLRFQPASEPADPRFIGPNPVGHALRPPSLFDAASYIRRTILNAIWPQRGYQVFREPRQVELGGTRDLPAKTRCGTSVPS